MRIPFSITPRHHGAFRWSTLSAVVIVALALSSCAGPSFHREWRSAATAARDANGDAACGRWEGTWKSDMNGHHGKLACITSAPRLPSQEHEFFYRATWMRLLSGSYRAHHQVTPKPNGDLVFSGRHQMPDWAGGEYRYEGLIRGNVFTARYECAKDRGTYEMRRVPSHP